MALFNWRSSSEADKPGANAGTAARPAAEEERLRTVARRRLIGATVLVTLTVLIFPWVFKQQPKPLNDDLIIEVPRKDAAKAALPVAAAAANTSTAAAPPVPTAASIPDPISTTPEKTAQPNATVAAATAAVAAATVVAANKPDAKPDNKADAKPAAATPAPAATPAKPAAAKPPAPVEAKAPTTETAPASSRFVVQVAAFAEANKARDVRIKLETQGYKTYSQAIDSPKGKVWRVRVGPYDNKAEAEKAKSQLSGKGFQPALLEL
jgi:DedD protein